MRTTISTSIMTCIALATLPASAADVTYERLLKPEPQNWLMNHHDFGAQRYSALDTINRSNVRNLKLAFAIALGGTSTDEYLQLTPLVDDGFMYLVDSWGIVSKVDVRSGTAGQIVWQMNPKQEKQDRNRGVALWNNLVISQTGFAARVIATDRDTGKVVWDTNLLDQADLELTAAPLALKEQIIVGGSGGDRGIRPWVVSLDARTGALQWKTHSVPAPGEPGSETWKGGNNAWQTGGGSFYVTGSYDPDTNLTYWGSGNPAPAYDPTYRPGDNLYTSSALAFHAATGKVRWHHQYTPNDSRDYDESGTHIIIDTKVNGEDRKILSHAGRNGFDYVATLLWCSCSGCESEATRPHFSLSSITSSGPFRLTYWCLSHASCMRQTFRFGGKAFWEDAMSSAPRALALSFVLLGAVPPATRAEVSEISVAQQYGVSFLPLMVMEKNALIQKYAAQAGLPDIKVSWVKVAGPSTMNDGLIANSLHFAAQGAPSMITLWDKTRGQIKGVAAMTTYPLYLITRNPAVKSIKDFAAKDKIAVPSIKISTQAIMLQMAASKAFGAKDFSRLDPLTVSLSHPDATLAFMNNTAGVNAHFTSSPFYEREIKMPGAHLVTTNYEILGGPATAVLITASSKFRDANPKAYRAFLEALTEAIDTINKDKRVASEVYLQATNDTTNSVDDINTMISDKDYAFTLQPQKVLKTAQFMTTIGSINRSPASIGDLFFDDLRGLKGD